MLIHTAECIHVPSDIAEGRITEITMYPWPFQSCHKRFQTLWLFLPVSLGMVIFPNPLSYEQYKLCLGKGTADVLHALHSYGQKLSLFHYKWKKNWSPLTGAPKGTSMELQRRQQHHFWLCDKRFSLESTHLTLSPRDNGPIIRVMAAAFQLFILQKQNLNPTNLFTAGSAGVDKILTFPPFSILGFFKHNVL